MVSALAVGPGSNPDGHRQHCAAEGIAHLNLLMQATCLSAERSLAQKLPGALNRVEANRVQAVKVFTLSIVSDERIAVSKVKKITRHR